MYKKGVPNPETNEEHYIVRKSDNAFIPINEENRDYQEYLKWLSDGNTPEEADSE